MHVGFCEAIYNELIYVIIFLYNEVSITILFTRKENIIYLKTRKLSMKDLLDKLWILKLLSSRQQYVPAMLVSICYDKSATICYHLVITLMTATNLLQVVSSCKFKVFYFTILMRVHAFWSKHFAFQAICH